MQSWTCAFVTVCSGSASSSNPAASAVAADGDDHVLTHVVAAANAAADVAASAVDAVGEAHVLVPVVAAYVHHASPAANAAADIVGYIDYVPAGSLCIHGDGDTTIASSDGEVPETDHPSSMHDGSDGEDEVAVNAEGSAKADGLAKAEEPAAAPTTTTCTLDRLHRRMLQAAAAERRAHAASAAAEAASVALTAANASAMAAAASATAAANVAMCAADVAMVAELDASAAVAAVAYDGDDSSSNSGQFRRTGKCLQMC